MVKRAPSRAATSASSSGDPVNRLSSVVLSGTVKYNWNQPPSYPPDIGTSASPGAMATIVGAGRGAATDGVAAAVDVVHIDVAAGSS